MKSGLFKKWWLLQHIRDPNGTWGPVKLWTFFGQPVAFMFFRAWGHLEPMSQQLGRLTKLMVLVKNNRREGNVMQMQYQDAVQGQQNKTRVYQSKMDMP